MAKTDLLRKAMVITTTKEWLSPVLRCFTNNLLVSNHLTAYAFFLPTNHHAVFLARDYYRFFNTACDVSNCLVYTSRMYLVGDTLKVL